MFDRRRCPECDRRDTERAVVDWWEDRVIEVRICENCPAQYEVHFGSPYKEVTVHGAR